MNSSIINGDSARADAINGCDEIIRKNVVPLTDNIGQDADLTCHYMTQIPGIFQRDGRLVRTIKRGNNIREIEEVNEHTLTSILSKHMFFRRYSEKTQRDVVPPPNLIKIILTLHEYEKIPELIRIAPSPFFDKHGRYICAEGYDAESKTFADFCGNTWASPDSYSQTEATSKIQTIIDLVRDFPFATERDRSIWIAFLLTILLRALVKGPVPFFLFDGNRTGAGKTLLVQISHLILTGEEATLSLEVRDWIEQEKRIAAELMKNPILVCIDDIRKELGNGPLDAIITSGKFGTRILGTLEHKEFIVSTVFAGTGTNIQFAREDTRRRSLICRLETQLENPFQPREFAHSDLRTHVRAQRASILSVLASIALGYMAQDSRISISPMPGFESFNIVREILLWCGLPDPFQPADYTSMFVPEQESLSGLMTGIERVCLNRHVRHLTSGELNKICSSPPLTRQQSSEHDEVRNERSEYSTVAQCLRDLCGCQNDTAPTPTKITSTLMKHRDKPLNGRRLKVREVDHQKVWSVEKIPQQNDSNSKEKP